MSDQQNDIDYAVTDNTPEDRGMGQYPFASERLLTEDDLAGRSAYDLKIMRNEIFARHGYI